MAKAPMNDNLINQHKKMAMGDKVTGMKKGGKVKEAKKEMPKKKK